MNASASDTFNPDRLVGRMPAIVRAGLAGLILCGLILAMVAERASILRSGATVRLATVPVDPRDLFRGDYVVLSYEISAVNLTRIGVTKPVERNQTIYVGLRARPDGKAEASRLAFEGEPREPGLVWLQGKSGYAGDCAIRVDQADNCAQGDSVLRVTYGLESYFVPQGEGRRIETTQASRVEIVAAVAASGKSAIKALLIDGKPVYDEPPY